MAKFKGTRSIKDLMSGVPSEPEITWRRKRANNTVEYATTDGSRHIRFHDTNILTYTPEGDTIINTNGWQTRTTQERINRFLTQGKICQERSIWYLYLGTSYENYEKYVYRDGMRITENNKVLGAESEKQLKKTLKQIDKYVDGYCKELFACKLAPPSSADCWYCSLHNSDGISLGEMNNNRDHLLSHFKEKDYVPSLVVNALDYCGASLADKQYLAFCFNMHDQRSEWFEGIASKHIRKSLRRYLRKQLGLAT